MSVRRTPGSGFIPNFFNTHTCECPPPIKMRSLTTGVVGFMLSVLSMGWTKNVLCGGCYWKRLVKRENTSNSVGKKKCLINWKWAYLRCDLFGSGTFRSDEPLIRIQKRFMLSIWSFTLLSNLRLRFFARAMNRRQIVSRCGGVQKCVYESWILAAIRSINWMDLAGYMEGERILPFFGMVSITIFTPCVKRETRWRVERTKKDSFIK